MRRRELAQSHSATSRGLILLVVSVELWPYGSEDAKEVLAEAAIANCGKDELGYTYRAALRERGDPELNIKRREQIVEISGYDRCQSVWNLLLKLLERAATAQVPVGNRLTAERLGARRGRPQRLGFMKGAGRVPVDLDRDMETVEVHAGNEALTRQPAGRTAAEEHALGLFLDVIPSAWNLTEREVERLLDVSPGWLRAWRNHEVGLDSAVRAALAELGSLQERMRLIATPDRYSEFWHHAWPELSAIGNRTPWQAFEEDGREALTMINRSLAVGLQ